MEKGDGFLDIGKKKNRLAEYKTRSVICNQETRRLQLLSDQKRKREETLNALRSATGLFSELEDESEDKEENEKVMEWTETKPQQPHLKDMFMFSEWMVKVPEDLDQNWLFVMCPVGKRCLVRCTKGSTTVYGKRGYQMAKFQSALPNGSQRDYSGYRYSNSEVTILDCIWCSQTKTYFVLDVLSWKGQLYMETETSFRSFWIKSKIEEIPQILEKSERNPFSFVPLEYYPCDISTFTSVLSSHRYFPSNEPKIDGILFYHKETFYTPGSTPLVVWLKPFMVPEVLGIEIPEAYLQTRPLNYIDFNHYIEVYEEKQKLKKRKRRKERRKCNDEESQNVSEEMEFLEDGN